MNAIRPTRVLCTAIAGVAFATSRPALADDKSTAEGKSAIDYLVGGTFDTGIGPDRYGASSIGGRFNLLHPFVGGEGPGAAWLGYGADARLVTLGFHSVDAGIFQAVVRAGAAAGASGIELELTGGVGVGEQVMPLWGFGVLYGFPFFGLGISWQFPIEHDRPRWLEIGQFSFRITLPLQPCRSQFFHCSKRETAPATTR